MATDQTAKKVEQTEQVPDTKPGDYYVSVRDGTRAFGTCRLDPSGSNPVGKLNEILATAA